METQNIKIYDHTLYEFHLKISNITTHKQVTVPRKKFWQEQTAKVYLYDLEILSLKEHWRPGSEISELNYLKEEKCLDEHEAETFVKFVSYCRDPIKFLEENAYIHEMMKDFFCYDHENISSCFEDFALNWKIDLNQFKPYLLKLEKDWTNAFCSNPSLEDLIKSGFLIIQ